MQFSIILYKDFYAMHLQLTDQNLQRHGPSWLVVVADFGYGPLLMSEDSNFSCLYFWCSRWFIDNLNDIAGFTRGACTNA